MLLLCVHLHHIAASLEELRELLLLLEVIAELRRVLAIGIAILLKLLMELLILPHFPQLQFPFIHILKVLKNIRLLRLLPERPQELNPLLVLHRLPVREVDDGLDVGLDVLELVVLDVAEEDPLKAEVPKPFKLLVPVLEGFIGDLGGHAGDADELIRLDHTRSWS